MNIVVLAHKRPHLLAEQTMTVVPSADVLVHREEDAEEFEPYLPDTANLWVMGTEPGICGKAIKMREYMRHIPEGEWTLFLDDDIKSILRLSDPWYTNDECPTWDIQDPEERAWAREQFNTLELKEEDGSLQTLLEEMIEEAERNDINIVGCVPTSNVLHRSRKWIHHAFVYGNFMFIRKTELTVPLVHVEDWHMTLKHLWRDGKALRNGFTYVNVAARYREGGYGKRDGREQIRGREFEWVAEQFGDLVRFYHRKNGDPELMMRTKVGKRLDRFQAEHPFWNYDLIPHG